MRIKKPKTIKMKSEPIKTTIKKNPIKNLGKYAHAAKLPTGAKIGKSTGQFGVHDV
jgi:hypothetical protein